MAREEYIQEINGVRKRGYSWLVEGEPVGNVVIVTGMAEHSTRYNNFANFLNENGYNVYCVDHYGQGLTAGNAEKLGLVPNDFFARSVEDIDELVKTVKANSKPTYVFAHSMGSFMLQSFIQRFPNDADKVVICGTNGPNGKGLYKAGYLVAKLLSPKKKYSEQGTTLNKITFGGYNKKIKNPRTEFDWLSVNEENVDKYIADPFCGFIPSKGFFREFIKGNAGLFKASSLKNINKDLPILLVAGTDDPVGAYGKGPAALAKKYQKLGIKNVELKLYQGLRHEILNEKEKDAVYNDILAFLK